jgi:hypothetical protein
VKARALAAAVAMLAAIGCSGREEVANDTWGGPNIELVVTSSGAVAQFKCGATGAIGEPLVLHGSVFDEAGTYTSRLVASGAQPARYVGSVTGTTMDLQVTVAGQPIGTFRLVEGARGTFEVCNF